MRGETAVKVFYAIFCRSIRFFARFGRSLLVLAFVLSLGFNLALLTVSGVYIAASSALSAFGLPTLAAKEAGERMARRDATRKLGRKAAERVTRRAQRSAARNLATASAEALPVIGVAAIASALAYEVKDACDTARDMTGLEAALSASDNADIIAIRRAAEEDFNCGTLIPGHDSLPTREQIWRSATAAPLTAWNAAVEQYVGLAAIDWHAEIVAARRAIIVWLSENLSADAWEFWWRDPSSVQ